MYKLTVVAGPTRGATFAVASGETTLGRQTGNSITLASSKVSKRHCTVRVVDTDVTLTDLGSSNGTFVNGELTKQKKLKVGDRIGVGEYIFELSKPMVRAPAPMAVMRPSSVQQSAAFTTGVTSVTQHQEPTDLPGKIFWTIENKLMPFLYGLAFKNEWRVLVIALMSTLVLGNLVLSVYPVLEQNQQNLINEMKKRASFIAKQIAEKNSQFLAARMETKTDIGSIDSAEGVRIAYLTDVEGRILAPANKMNQYVSSGPEGAVMSRARIQYRKGLEVGMSEVSDDVVVAIEPIRVLSTQLGRNVTIGLAVASLDAGSVKIDLGEVGVTYSKSLIFTALFGGLISFLIYRVTLKPLEVLNDDMDKVLKGEISQITHEFKFEELNPLWAIIRSALQRIPKQGSEGEAHLDGGISPEEVIGPLRALGASNRFAVMVLDANRKIVFVNANFEEATGIRADSVQGQDVASVARDQSLSPFLNDLMDRAANGVDSVIEDTEFSGVAHQCSISAFGSPPKCYLFYAVRAEG